MKKAHAYSSFLLVMIFMIYISLGLPDSIMGSAWPNIRADFGLPIANISFYSSVALVFSILTSIYYPKIAKRFNMYQIFFWSVMGVMVALGIMALAPNGWILYLAFPFFGVGQGAIDVAVNTFAARHFSPGLMSVLHGFYGIGASLSSTIVAFFLATQFGWRGATVFILLLQLVIFAVVIFGRQSLVEKVEEEAHEANVEIKLGLQHYYGPIFFFLYTGLEIVVANFLSSYHKATYDLTDAQAASQTAIFLVTFTIGRFANGLLVKWFKQISLVYASLAIAVLGMLLLPVSAPLSSGLIGLGFAILFPVAMTFPHRAFAPQVADRVVNVQMTYTNVGLLLLPLVFGQLFNLVSVAAFPWLAGGTFLVMLVFLLLAISTLQKHEKTS
jgi:fucose permease